MNLCKSSFRATVCIHNMNLDKNMARLRRDQGQVNPDGEPQVDRNGILS